MPGGRGHPGKLVSKIQLFSVHFQHLDMVPCERFPSLEHFFLFGFVLINKDKAKQKEMFKGREPFAWNHVEVLKVDRKQLNFRDKFSGMTTSSGHNPFRLTRQGWNNMLRSL